MVYYLKLMNEGKLLILN